MSDPKWENSWDQEKLAEIKSYKKMVADLRVPFAKQEHRNGEAINDVCSIAGINFESKSYRFNVKGKVFDVRELINQFELLMKSIKHQHILQDLRENQG